MDTKNTEGGDDLARSGLKTTKQRAEILGILKESDRPLTAEQIFLALKKKNAPVNLSTVYRVLEALSGKALAVKLSIPGESRALFEYNHAVHRHHLVCLGCKKILTIRHCPLAEYEKVLAAETDFSISGHKLDVYGYCPACRDRRERP